MAKDVIITPLDGDIQFSNASGTDAGKIEQFGDDLVISNAVGDVLLGDGDIDVYIGDGTANVDIVFEQDGSIRGEVGGAVALTLGSSDTTLKLGSDLDVNGKSIVSASNGDITIVPNGTGKVGIGQTSPTVPLEVIGTIKQKTGSGYTNYVQQSVSEAQLTFSTYSNNQTSFPSAIKFSPNGTEAVRIDNAGNVGIGTSSPVSPLHIYQNDGYTGTPSGITIEQAGTGDAVLQFLIPGSRRWVAGIDNSDGDRFKIASTSDVGTDDHFEIVGTSGVAIFNGTQLQTSSDTEVRYGNITTTQNGSVVNGGFMNPAAEDNMVHLPHVVNDLAGFQKWGTITVSGLYKTRSGSAGSYTYSNPVSASDFDSGAAFDGYSSTAGSWYSDDGPDGTTAGVGVVTLEWTNELQYTAFAGIVFGSTSFTAERVKIEAYRGGAWQTLCDLTDNQDHVVMRQIGSNSGAGSATTKLRYTLGGSVNNSYFRIHTLYAANYRAGDNNLSGYPGTDYTRGVHYLEKYKTNYAHGHFRPAATNTYNLGDGSLTWANIYANGGNSSQWNTAYGWGNHASVGYLSNIIEDTTPQLGGTLDINSNNIIGAGSIIVSGTIGNLGTNIGQQLELGSSAVTTLRFDSDAWRLYAGGTGSSGELVRVTETGNVGIGTTSPTSKLHVEGAAFINNGLLKIQDSSVTNYYESDQMNSYGTYYDWKFAGSRVMRINSSGNVGIGTASPSAKLDVVGLANINDGSENVMISSLNTSLSTAVWNTALGSYAGYSLSTGSWNTAIGAGAMTYTTTGHSNVSVGYTSLYNVSSGAHNVGIGRNSLERLTTGNYNVAVGSLAARGTAGSQSFSNTVAVGYEALTVLTTGGNNTAIGYQSGYSITTGQQNVMLGYKAGYNETGSNKLYIANSDTTTPLIYGEFNNEILNVNGKLKPNSITVDDEGLSAAGDYGSGAEIWYQGSTSTTAAGYCYYLNSSGEWSAASDGGATSAADATGMLAMAAGTDPDGDGMILRGFVQCFQTNLGGSVGDTVYLSSSGGRLTTTKPTSSGSFVRRVGYLAKGTNIIYFNPSMEWEAL